MGKNELISVKDVNAMHVSCPLRHTFYKWGKQIIFPNSFEWEKCCVCLYRYNNLVCIKSHGESWWTLW